MADPLSLTVNVEKASYDKGETVVFTGFVLDPNGGGVPYATVSIEVTDPDENQVHVAMTISGSDGSFNDELKVPNRGAEGTYTVYISASKAGYEDANLTTNYTVIPEFGFNGSPILVLASALILILLSRRKRFTMRERALTI